MHASALRDERAGKMKTNIIIVDDGQEDKMDPDELKVGFLLCVHPCLISK